MLLPTIIAGLIAYFDRALGANLLYRFERPQYAEIRRQFVTGPKVIVGQELEMSAVYGAEHLLRMLGECGRLRRRMGFRAYSCRSVDASNGFKLEHGSGERRSRARLRERAPGVRGLQRCSMYMSHPLLCLCAAGCSTRKTGYLSRSMSLRVSSIRAYRARSTRVWVGVAVMVDYFLAPVRRCRRTAAVLPWHLAGL